jgi:hypothetical protein
MAGFRSRSATLWEPFLVTVGSDKQPEWHFFISYAQPDRRWAEWIAWLLEEKGYRVLVQAWDFVPGSNWVQKMQDGASRADRTIAVLSHDYLTSTYGAAEWQAAWAADPLGENRKFLPFRVNDCDRPGFLATIVGPDLFGVPEDKATERLLTAVATAVAGRAKPAARPVFPLADRAVPQEVRFPGALPHIWNVPAGNPHFTGRGGELAGLSQTLTAGATVTVHSVRGMGGVGKTQLSNQYAQLHADAYDLVWWITAEEPALIPDQFAKLAVNLGIQAPTEPDVLAAVVHKALRNVPGWLLVFDNADSVEDIRPWLPAMPMPTAVPGHVIVTTRRGGFGALGPVLNLDVVNIGDAVQIMRTRVPDIPDDIARRIAEELGRLPLALEQAAAYLDKEEMPADVYLDLLLSRAEELHKRGQVAGHERNIATLWDLSLEKISALEPAAVQLLEICAYLAPEPVPSTSSPNTPTIFPSRSRPPSKTHWISTTF